MKKNIIANIAGRFWSILSNFAFIPLYIKYLGFESYAVISFTLILAGILAVADAGLTATLSREFARTDKSDDEKIKVYKTLETAYWLVIVVCIGLVALFSGLIANNVHVKSYTHDQISNFLKIVSIDIGFQLLLRFYMGGILGLERQVKANILQILWGVFRNGLVILVIYIYPNLTMFFLWQSTATVIFTFIFKFTLDALVYKKRSLIIPGFFDINRFNDVRKFAGGIMMISIVASLNTQMDKMTISKLMDINNLGYYTLGISIASALPVLVNPIATALLPRFTSLYSQKDITKVKALFNQFSIIISIMVFTLMSLFIFFAKDILWVWTGNINLATKVSKVLPLLAISYAFISLQGLPYHIAIANGYTKINNVLGLSSLLFTMPGYFYGIRNYGVMGAAGVFMGVQVITTFIYIFLINRKFLNEEIIKTIMVKQFLIPLFLALMSAYTLSYFSFYFSLLSNRLITFCWLSGFAALVFCITAFFSIDKSNLNLYKLFKNLNDK